MRAINDPGFRHIFCLIHAEKLTYQVSDIALTSLSKHSQGKKGGYIIQYDYKSNTNFFFWIDYRLVIISSNEEEEKSHFISKLHLHKRPFLSRSNVAEIRGYLAAKLTMPIQEMEDLAFTSASVVDYDK